MNRSIASLVSIALLLALVPVVALASCAAADTQITLTDFDADGEQIYVAVEGQNPAETFTAVRRGLSCNDNRSVQVDYELMPGTAGPPRLNVAGGREGTLTLQAPPRSGSGSGTSATRNFTVMGEGPNDVQHATLRLQNVGEAGLDQVKLGNPSAASVFVVDNNGTDRFGFGLATYSRLEGFSLGIPVFRSGPAVGPANDIGFTIEGTGGDRAEPEDYVVDPAPLDFADGERVQVIEIAMSDERNFEGDEQLTVTLDGGSTTVVTIENLDPGSGALRPTGRLHHPKHKYKYPQNYPWLNEIHIFTQSADRDLIVRRAEMSIVKKLKNGGMNSCRWWNGKRFVNQRCVDRRWFDAKKRAKDYFLHRIKQKLPLSVGRKSNVDHYEIRARWRDNKGNASSLRVGRNQNRFEVIGPTKACRNNPFNFRKCKPVRP
jgi:Calx-beta domain